MTYWRFLARTLTPGCPPSSAIADMLTGNRKWTCFWCWQHLTKMLLLASWNRSRIQLGPIMRLFRKFFLPPPDKADVMGIFPLPFCRWWPKLVQGHQKCLDLESWNPSPIKKTNPLSPIWQEKKKLIPETPNTVVCHLLFYNRLRKIAALTWFGIRKKKYWLPLKTFLDNMYNGLCFPFSPAVML